MSEELLDFPCEFPIKMMGRDDPEFRAAALAVVERHAGKIEEDAIRITTSSNGNFLSITVTITATSREQLDIIYRDLTDDEQILVAL
ncbi:MAG: YbeD family protein [Woeseiaceae bacterium]